MLLFAPNVKAESYVEQMRLLAAQSTQSAERDLLLISLFEQGPGRLENLSISVAAASEARAKFDIPSDSFAVLLIGKHGDVEWRVSNQFLQPTYFV